MTHKFKVGSEWITRGGWKAVVVEDDESSLPFLVDHGDGERRWHFPDGDCQNEDSDFGLIAPWEEPAPSARDGVPMSDALSPAELENARHALGLPNKAKRSYRNRYVCPEDDELWQGLVARGLAKFRAAKSLPFGRAPVPQPL